MGTVAILNDLHKGRDTGPYWSLFIDAISLVTAFVSLTGLILIFYLRRKRLSGITAAEILNDLLPRNISVQILKALLENSASFYGAQMSAMDNATRNAGEMIGQLQLSYNRQRQAQITKELIEIISGAEAL